MAKKPKAAKSQPVPKDAPEFVKMVRDADAFPAPHEANVHPSEVENYRVGGWQEA